MKIRTGFVSNSSSSNFILRVLKGSTEEDIREMLDRQIGNMEGFFIPDFKKNLIDTIMKCKGDKNYHEKQLEWEVEWIEGHPDSSTDEINRLQAMVDDGFDHYHGGFSDEGEGAIQLWLCSTCFKIEEDDFFMENNSGY